MSNIQIILYPTDFSSCSMAAFDLACTVANAHQARLVVLHVTEPPLSMLGGTWAVPPMPEEYRLAEANKQLHAIQPSSHNFELQYRLVVGEPAEAILAIAREIACDMIVMGTHGRTGVERLLMGSIAEKVTRKARCPVVTVKAAARKPGALDEPSPKTAGAAA